MLLIYEIHFIRKTWNIIGTAEIEVKSFSEGDVVIQELLLEKYAVTEGFFKSNIPGGQTYAGYSLTPSISLEDINI